MNWTEACNSYLRILTASTADQYCIALNNFADGPRQHRNHVALPTSRRSTGAGDGGGAVINQTGRA